jgi:hypothetical protein
MGKTTEQVELKPVATFYATKVKNPNGLYSDIEKIVEARDASGEMGYLLKMANGVVMGVSPLKDPDAYALQIMEGDPLREVIRFGVTVAVNDEKELRGVKQAAPLLRGVWVANRVSRDSGKTYDLVAPTPVATVHADKVKGPRGDFSEIVNVVEVSQGRAALYFITLSNGATWAAIEREKPGDYLLQIMSGEPKKEAIRYEVSVRDGK